MFLTITVRTLNINEERTKFSASSVLSVDGRTKHPGRNRRPRKGAGKPLLLREAASATC